MFLNQPRYYSILSDDINLFIDEKLCILEEGAFLLRRKDQLNEDNIYYLQEGFKDVIKKASQLVMNMIQKFLDKFFNNINKKVNYIKKEASKLKEIKIGSEVESPELYPYWNSEISIENFIKIEGLKTTDTAKLAETGNVSTLAEFAEKIGQTILKDKILANKDKNNDNEKDTIKFVLRGRTTEKIKLKGEEIKNRLDDFIGYCSGYATFANSIQRDRDILKVLADRAEKEVKLNEEFKFDDLVNYASSFISESINILKEEDTQPAPTDVQASKPIAEPKNNNTNPDKNDATGKTVDTTDETKNQAKKILQAFKHAAALVAIKMEIMEEKFNAYYKVIYELANKANETPKEEKKEEQPATQEQPKEETK